MSPSSLVEIANLHKSFVRADGQRVAAIDDISLTVRPGEFVVLLGPSGCGKTTLLRCLAGLETPDSGTIRMRGETYFADGGRRFVRPEKRRLSMVFQSYALWPHMTVFDNVAFPLRNRGVSKSDAAARVMGALERVSIAGLRRSHPSQISGGQQQRVALARALVTEDELILFDEPLSNVDARVRDALRFELLEMQREIGFAAVYVTHDQSEAMAMADNIVVLGEGKVRQSGPPHEIYTKPASRQVACFVGAANEVPGTVIALEEDGLLLAGTPLGKVRATARSEHLGAGDDIVLVWRPENGAITAGGSSSDDSLNSWPATVLASVFVGAHTEADLAVGGLKQRVWSAEHELPASGEHVRLSVSPRHLLAFDG